VLSLFTFLLFFSVQLCMCLLNYCLCVLRAHRVYNLASFISSLCIRMLRPKKMSKNKQHHPADFTAPLHCFLSATVRLPVVHHCCFYYIHGTNLYHHQVSTFTGRRHRRSQGMQWVHLHLHPPGR